MSPLGWEKAYLDIDTNKETESDIITAEAETSTRRNFMLDYTCGTVDVGDGAMLVPATLWIDLSLANSIEGVVGDVRFEDVEGAVEGNTPALVATVGGRISLIYSERNVVLA